MRRPRLFGDPWDQLGLAVLALFILLIVISHMPDCIGHAAAAKKEPTELIKGYEYGKAFLGAKKKKGKKYRRNVSRMAERFKAWFVKYALYEIVEMASRVLLESRGNWYSHTKDTTIHEAALCSNGYEFTKMVCLEYGVCGDPCGDPEFSIALASFRRYLARRRMIFDETAENGGENFWHPWLYAQCIDNRFECEVIIAGCGSINCQKLRMAMVYAGTNDPERCEGKDGVMHCWWKTINYLRDQDEAKIATIFAPKKNLWQIGSRLGRAVAMKFMRAEFYAQEESTNGDKPKVEYGWGDTPEQFAYFPMRIEMEEVDGVMVPVQVPDFPEPLYPTGPKFMKKSDWRKRCVLYGRTKAWKTVTGEPKNPKERYKKTACRDGVCWKKGQRKYPTRADFDAARAAWKAEQQEIGTLPTDAEQAAADAVLAEMGLKLKLFEFED